MGRQPACHTPRPAAVPQVPMANKKWLHHRLKEAAGGQAAECPDSAGSKDNARRPACSRTFCRSPGVLSPRHLLQLGLPGCLLRWP